MSLQRERTFILALLLILAAASWVMLIWQSGMLKSMGIGPTMRMGATSFLAIWVVMMIAMMFPATASMNLAFARVQRDRHAGRQPSMSTWIFVGAYLLVWTLFGGLSYLGANAASELARTVPWLMRNATRIGGGILGIFGDGSLGLAPTNAANNVFFTTSALVRDYPMIMALAMLVAVLWGVMYLVSDVLYALIDPRVGLAGAAR